MMKRTVQKMKYTENSDGAQVVELPYGKDQRFAAVVLIPRKGTDGLAKFISPHVDRSSGIGSASANTELSTMLRHLRTRPVALQLPRFKVEFGVHDLTPELRSAFGMNEPFDGSGGFLGMSDDKNVHISQVFHKAVVEVNEEGTKAAAATAAVMMTRSIVMPMEPPKTVIVDRPFLFLIRDRHTGLFLFAGIVEDPELDMAGLAKAPLRGHR
jgi:serpin B